jgi:hypothetical protein
MRYYTDDLIAATPLLQGLTADQVQARVNDAGGLYQYIQQHPGIEDTALQAWVATIGRTLNDLAAAMQLLLAWGHVYPLESPLLPAARAPAAVPMQPVATDVAGGRRQLLAAMARPALYDIATAYGVRGRSTMTVEQLVAAIIRHEEETAGAAAGAGTAVAPGAAG